jgi:alkylated DNA nucleotide flippase Atl1
MYHLLEVRDAPAPALVAWMRSTPIYRLVAERAGMDAAASEAWAWTQLRRLVDEGVLVEQDGRVAVWPQAH